MEGVTGKIAGDPVMPLQIGPHVAARVFVINAEMVKGIFELFGRCHHKPSPAVDIQHFEFVVYAAAGSSLMILLTNQVINVNAWLCVRQSAHKCLIKGHKYHFHMAFVQVALPNAN
jgi:hypothetical protein